VFAHFENPHRLIDKLLRLGSAELVEEVEVSCEIARARSSRSHGLHPMLG
jgi:hypothetical protein